MRNVNLERIADRILSQPGNQWGIEITFITPSGNTKGYSVLEFHNVEDYVMNFTGAATCQAMVSMLEYRYKMFPHRDNLHAYVKWFPLDASANTYLSATPVLSTMYRALLLDNDDYSNSPGSQLTAQKTVTAQDENLLLRVQLVDKQAEVLSYKQGQGTFRMTNTDNILAGYLAEMIRQEAQTVPLMSNMRLAIEPVDNEVLTQREAITIPITVPITSVPRFLQEKEGGLYANGIGSFIKSGTWWIFPPWDVERFVKTTRRLKIIQLESMRGPVQDNTWEYRNGELTIICTSGFKMQDLSVSNQINEGTGTRFVKASDMFQQTEEGMPNKERFNSEKVLAEFQVGEREDENAIAKFSKTMFTDNIANEYSKIAWRKGQIFITLWHRSILSLLDPGMPVRLFQDKDGKVVQYDGVLIRGDEQWSPETPGMVDKNMIAVSALMCFINKEPVDGL